LDRQYDRRVPRSIFLVAVLASALCLGACGDDPPSLTEIREFRAYPVYWSGNSIAGNSLIEVTGDPTLHEDKRETIWVLIYGRCKDPPDEGGCPPPLQIHSYSTCTRWAGRGAPLFDLRGAKAVKPFPGGGAAIEIFTGKTTVTMHAENQHVLEAAIRDLRTVQRERPFPSLPPPAPGSLEGKLPCQGDPTEPLRPYDG
jgi:hypothetical protein